MLLGYLILAHLLGDFIFQPNKLVLLKSKSQLGIFIHVLIHFVITVLILLPFVVNGYYWLVAVAFAVSFVHFFIDSFKINYDLNHDKKVGPFLIDQLMHLLTMMVAYFFVQNIPLSLPQNAFNVVYTDIRVIIFLSFVILCSTVVDIYHFQSLREKKHNATLKIDSVKMWQRILVFTLVYALFIILSFYARGNHG